MKIGLVNIVKSSEYQDLLEERNILAKANERLHTNIQTLENRLEESRKNNSESQKIFSYLFNFYLAVHDSMGGVNRVMKEYCERK